MKKLVFVIAVLLLAAATAWYFFRQNDRARDTLPADAVAVVTFDPVELAAELDIGLRDILSLLKSEDDDGSMGIDLTQPAYAFMSESGLPGVALNVSDADKLLASVSRLGFSSEKQRGVQWIRVGMALGCLDRDKMLLCWFASEAEQTALRDKMLRLMKQSRQEVPILDRANKQKGFLRMSTSLRNLPKAYMPANLDLFNAFQSASLTIGEQDVTLSARLEDEDGKSYAAEFTGEEILRPIDGLLKTVLPTKPFAWLCFNVKGEQLLKIMRSYPQWRNALMALNVNFFDADLMLEAIDGDVVIMMPKADLAHHDMLITARISNSDFLTNVDEWNVTSQAGASLQRRGSADDYVFTFMGMTCYFGVRDDVLYIASSEQLADHVLFDSETNDLLQTAAGKYLSGSIDISQFIKYYASMALMLGATPQIYEAVDAIDKITLSADTPWSMDMSLQTRKPIKDILLGFLKKQ